MTLDHSFKDFPETEPRRSFAKRFWLVVLVVAVLAGFGGALWLVYQEGLRRGSENVAPIITAEETPIKVRPESPGGMAVPHRDKTVYEKIAPAVETPAAERLLPPPEEPVVRRAPDTAAPVIPEEALAPPVASPSTAEPDATRAPAAEPDVPAPPAQKELTPAEAGPQSGSTLAMIGPYRLQLASLRSAEAAAEAWGNLQAKHGDIMSRFDLIVEKVDLGAQKGIYYRVQAAPVASQAEGNELCAQLKKRQVACLVIKR